LVNIDAGFRPEDGHDQRQPYRNFGCCHGHDEENENLPA